MTSREDVLNRVRANADRAGAHGVCLAAEPAAVSDVTRARVQIDTEAAAWNLARKPGGKQKGEGILVFQPDTGVADHVELEAGMINTALAYDFVENRRGAVDPMNYSGNPGHGTGTASVVASRGAGKVAGAAPLATLVSLRAVTSVVGKRAMAAARSRASALRRRRARRSSARTHEVQTRRSDRGAALTRGGGP
jgi:hypothetical protein